MYNKSMQNNPTPTGSMIEPASQPQFAPSAAGAAPLNTGAQLTSTAPKAPTEQKKSHNTLIETILLVIVSLIAVLFIWLYIQKYIEWDAISTNVDSQIESAVAVAIEAKTTELEAEFAEREKFPYKDFMGPADYGSFSFQYPQTWSVYVAKDAVGGGDFEAYFNPGEVNPVSATSINALRMRIRDTSFDSVVRGYESQIKNGKLALRTEMVGGVLANIYTGELATNMRGAIMILKLRDKTVMLQTDAETFLDDFYRVLETVKLVE